jgi:excinuclease ABC subunit A
MPPANKKKTARPVRNANAIEVRGARQNNLKGFDVDIPIGKLTVVTGPSGSGKSSFAFQTVYAEGQRRYVETFSPYTRQFFDRMDKPQVDAINGIPPAIAIEQANNVRSTRSTVGTITEINDYLKLLFPRLAVAHCPECKQIVQPDTPKSILEKLIATQDGESVLVTFGIPVPAKTKPSDFFEFLKSQGYLRVYIYDEVHRTDDPSTYKKATLPSVVKVIQDRIKVATDKRTRTRLHEAVEAALNFGKGQVTLIGKETKSFSTRWHCADCDLPIRPPVPGLFTFNNPIGACPECRGFGRTIGIDLDRAIPDKSLSIAEGVVKAFSGSTYYESQKDLLRCCLTNDVDIDTPFDELPKKDQDWVINGDSKDPEDAWTKGEWYGVQGFFDWMETKAYKMHVRVYLSRFRSYTTCRKCKGTRLKPESLYFTVAGKTLPDLWHLPISDLQTFFQNETNPKPGDTTAETLLTQIQTRIAYLCHVGLTYLDLDRPTRTLSGGEVQRVNLTTCLGASLVNTLFVLDEPSIGLHPRDTGRLIEIMETLRDKGNTLLVVEHEESVIRAADHLIDIGPGRGETGGELVYEGPAKATKEASKKSLTLSYLNGSVSIPIPKKRRKPKKGNALQILRATEHNLQRIDVTIPLGVFNVVTGVSGSGKSTLIHKVLYETLMWKKGESTGEEPGRCKGVDGVEKIGQVVMVDQSPLARTPRSTPAVYIGAFEPIRKLFAATPEAKAQGLQMGFFSFNSGAGRCERCWGNGYEKIEMQFLSDLFISCPECEGKRYAPDTLTFELNGKNIHQVLEMTITEAISFFSAFPNVGKKSSQETKILRSLQALADVGLTYLRLGQPLNTLSGGESQRLKLASHLLDGKQEKGALLIFDEPTTGLHFDDIRVLLQVFHRLVDEGNTVLVIEHNLEVIKNADHVIDLGPEAGSGGGLVVAEGTPEEVATVKESHTGRYLAAEFKVGSFQFSALEDERPSLRVAESANLKLKTENSISVLGARENNLKNIDINIPRDELVVITGLSGSGKSTLAFDILFAEGQRRFLDSMSTYARQFVEQMEKPEVDSVSGLPPTVAIEQRISRGGGKSTVATVTEVWHFLRLLWSKVGTQHCPKCDLPVEKQSLSAIVTKVRKAAKLGTVQLMAPMIRGRKGFHTEVAEWAGKQGYKLLFVDGQFKEIEGFQKLERFKEHTIDVVVAKITAKATIPEVQAEVEAALKIGKGTARLLNHKNRFHVLSSEMACPGCGTAFDELDPRIFSYNSPHGWCKTCRGYGYIAEGMGKFDLKHADSLQAAELDEEMRMAKVDASEQVTCHDCNGGRLNETSRSVRIGGHSISDVAHQSVESAGTIIDALNFAGSQATIARDILKEIEQRLRFMHEVGLSYLQLDRSAKTLSGGEAQRIRLAAQLGSNLTGVLYVLDEPTIGLHPRDNGKLLDTLCALRDNGNSVIIVEHDEETMRRAGHLIDLGPGAGQFGGEVVYAGSPKPLFSKTAKPKAGGLSSTVKVLGSPIQHPIRGERRKLPAKGAKTGWIRIKGATANNLKNIDVQIPIARLTAISGISGSGKSSLMRGVLKPAVGDILSKTKKNPKLVGLESISGVDELAAVYEVDQSPIGKTSRSTPATYVKVFDEIRKLFAQVPDARIRGYEAGRFSFNTEGGRCETCGGNGRIKLEMNFLPTSYVECEDCLGQRYNAPTLEIEYNGKNIGEVMQLTIDEATAFFEKVPKIFRTLKLLRDTGLGYLRIGQPSPTLSGGEAQRIKLVTQLTKGVARSETARLRQNRTPKSNLYLIEEPTIGLHMADVQKLTAVLHALVDDGHTVVVIEHNLDIIAEADHVLDIGPEAGENGGQVIAKGTPEDIVKVKESRTGPFLKGVL